MRAAWRPIIQESGRCRPANFIISSGNEPTRPPPPCSTAAQETRKQCASAWLYPPRAPLSCARKSNAPSAVLPCCCVLAVLATATAALSCLGPYLCPMAGTPLQQPWSARFARLRGRSAARWERLFSASANSDMNYDAFRRLSSGQISRWSVKGGRRCSWSNVGKPPDAH